MNLRAMKTIYIVLTACLIIGGILLTIWPNYSFDVICKAFGVFLIVYGVAKIIGYFSKEMFQLAFQYDFGLGTLSIILGLLMIIETQSVSNILTACIGIFLLIDAALKAQTSIESKRFGISQWNFIMTIAVLTGIVGIIILLSPHETTSAIVRLLGISFLIDGTLNLTVVCSTYRSIRNNKREMEM